MRNIRYKRLIAVAALLLSTLLSACEFGGDEYIQTETETEQACREVFLPIIMYHSVVKDSSKCGDYVITPDILSSDIEYLKKNGYNFILATDLVDYVYNSKELPEKCVMLTFDDGFYNFLTYVEPILRESGAKAVVSVVGSYAEKETNSCDGQSSAYSYLTYRQIKELSKCRYIEIACHSYNMHGLGLRRGTLRKDGESDEQYRSAFISDMLMCRKALADNCGITPYAFAYPYGFISDESREYVKACRFLVSFGVEEKPNYITADSECLYCLNRYNRGADMSTEEFMSYALSEQSRQSGA